MTMDDRLPKAEATYDDDEVRRILERGAELERIQSESAKRHRDGERSIYEIVSIAREAGISEGSVRLAAGELGGEPRSKASPFLGGPRTVQGLSYLPPASGAELESLVAALPSIAKRGGRGEARAGGLDWRSSALPGFAEAIRIQVRPAGKGLMLSVRLELSGKAARTYSLAIGCISLGLGMGVGIGLLNSAPLSIALFTAGLLPAYAVARLIYRSKVRKAEAEAKRIAGEIEKALG